MSTRRQPNRTIKNHQKRIELLQRIDKYLQENGSILFSDFVLEFDIYYRTLDGLYRYGFLDAQLVKSGKQNGKALLLTGVNWYNVNAVELPGKLYGRRKKLEQIDRLTLGNPVALKKLSKLVNIPVSTLRYWKHEGLLNFQYDTNRKVEIIGVNRAMVNGC